MTLIFSLIHDKYSILAADKRASAVEEYTDTSGEKALRIITVSEDAQKIFLVANGMGVMANAGHVCDHPIIDKSQLTTAQIHEIPPAMVEFSRHLYQEDKITAETPMRISETILNYFDYKLNNYSFSVFKYGPQGYTHGEVGSLEIDAAGNPKERQLVFRTLGSGSEAANQAFLEFMLKPESSSLLETQPSLEKTREMLKYVFEQSSINAIGCGPTFDAYISSRANREFVELK